MASSARMPPPVVPSGKYKKLQSGGITVYACRLVHKINANGGKVERVLLVTSQIVALVDTKVKVRRYMCLEIIKESAYKKEGDTTTMLLRMTEGSDEPDILFTQIEEVQEPATSIPPVTSPDGVDVLHLIRKLRKERTGIEMPIYNLTGTEHELVGNLKKSSSFSPPKYKFVHQGVKAPQSPTGEESRPSPKGPSTPEGPPPPLGGGAGERSYKVFLNHPQEDLGLQISQDTQGKIFIVNVTKGQAAARAGIPVGVLASVDGFVPRNKSELQAKLEELETAGVTVFDMTVIPRPEMQGVEEAASRALVVGVAYTGTRYELKGAPQEAFNMARALQRWGFCSQPQIRIMVDDGTTEPPTYENMKAALQWLFSDVKPGQSRFFSFVGHGVNQEGSVMSLRDGPNEAIYPCDFDQGGVIKEDFIASLVHTVPASANVLLVCDSHGTGCILNLPTKIKALTNGRLAVTSSTIPGRAFEAKVAQVSSCREQQSPTDERQPVGLITSAFITSINRNPSPTMELLCEDMKSLMKQRQATSTLMVACSWQASERDVFRIPRHVNVPSVPDTRIASPTHTTKDPHVARESVPSMRSKAGPPLFAAGSPQQLGSVVPQQPREAAPATLEGMMGLQGADSRTGLPVLSPEDLFAKVPLVLSSPGFARLVQRPEGIREAQGSRAIPELFYVAEIIVLEARETGVPELEDGVIELPDVGGDWMRRQRHTPGPRHTRPVTVLPTAKLVMLGSRALYVLDPNGDIDRCFPFDAISDFVLLKGGAALDAAITPSPSRPVNLPGTPGSQWLAVRVPTQYELLFQPTCRGGSTHPDQEIDTFLKVINMLLQFGGSQPSPGLPASVFVVGDTPTPQLLRLLRPLSFSYPWIPLNVRVWPAPRPLLSVNSPPNPSYLSQSPPLANPAPNHVLITPPLTVTV